MLGPFDITLNLLTIDGLVLVFGLLVDNCVVMTEQILLQRRRLASTGRSGIDLDTEATAEALEAVWIPLLGGTLSTMAVMLPLLYLSGELRSLFLPFGVLVALTLGASLLSAALLVPVLARYLPPPEPHRRIRFARHAAAAPFRVAARFPKTSLVVLALILGVPLWWVPAAVTVPSDKPESDSHVRLGSLYNSVLGSEHVQGIREKVDPAIGGVVRPFFRDVDFGQRWNYDPRPEVSVGLSFPPGRSRGRMTFHHV